MTDDQIVAAAKAIDTPYGKVGLIHARDDGTEVPTTIAKQFARSILVAATSESALEKFREHSCDELDRETPLERLRFFCSLAMTNGNDWLDSEQFFDAVEAQLAAPAPSDAQIRAIAICDGGGYQHDDTADWEFDDEGLLKFARALLAAQLADIGPGTILSADLCQYLLREQ